jgi:hypothetical protein
MPKQQKLRQWLEVAKTVTLTMTSKVKVRVQYQRGQSVSKGKIAEGVRLMK